MPFPNHVFVLCTGRCGSTTFAREGALPAGLTIDPDAYDAWFRAKVQEALDEPRSSVPHQQVMDEAQAGIDAKRNAHR